MLKIGIEKSLFERGNRSVKGYFHYYVETPEETRGYSINLIDRVLDDDFVIKVYTRTLVDKVSHDYDFDELFQVSIPDYQGKSQRRDVQRALKVALNATVVLTVTGKLPELDTGSIEAFNSDRTPVLARTYPKLANYMLCSLGTTQVVSGKSVLGSWGNLLQSKKHSVPDWVLCYAIQVAPALKRVLGAERVAQLENLRSRLQ